MLKRLDKQSRSAAKAEIEAAQTQAALNEEELFREVHKSDTHDTASRFQVRQQSVRCTRVRDAFQTQRKGAERFERQSTSKSDAQCQRQDSRERDMRGSRGNGARSA